MRWNNAWGGKAAAGARADLARGHQRGRAPASQLKPGRASADKAQAPPVAGDKVMQGDGPTASCAGAHPYAADAYELDVVLRAAVVEAVGVLVWSRGHRRESHWVVCASGA